MYTLTSGTRPSKGLNYMSCVDNVHIGEQSGSDGPTAPDVHKGGQQLRYSADPLVNKLIFRNTDWTFQITHSE